MVPPEHTLLVMIPAFAKQPTLEELSSTLGTLKQRFCSMLAHHTAQWTPLWSSSVVSSWWVDAHTAAFEVSSPLHRWYLAYCLCLDQSTTCYRFQVVLSSAQVSWWRGLCRACHDAGAQATCIANCALVGATDSRPEQRVLVPLVDPLLP